jgi:hypothetical protein
MLTLRGKPLFATYGPRARRIKPFPWWECILMIATLSLLCWLAIAIAISAFA